jgi:hypothetical protein
MASAVPFSDLLVRKHMALWYGVVVWVGLNRGLAPLPVPRPF